MKRSLRLNWYVEKYQKRQIEQTSRADASFL
jgi:hypothetical protein